MKKLFLFTVALLASLMVGATTHTLEPGERQIENVISSLVDGDVLELKTGTYTEWSSLIFTTKVTLKAAEGASPKLALYDWKIQNDFEINGVEITNVSTNNYLFRVYTSVAGTVAFKNCSMQLNANVTAPQAYIIVKSENSLGNLVIDNCTFKDNATSQGAVVLASGSSTNVTNLTMKNSTAYNCGTELTVWFEGLANADIDHCTFYNCGTRVLYLKANTMNNYSVQNCVIANATVPEPNNHCIASYAGEVKNCAYYNLNAPRISGTDPTATVNGCINANPKFVDPADGNFNFAFTSPLFLAATDGTHIGDPRWGVAEPETAIAIPDTLPATQAVLSGTKISATADGIKWNDNSDNPNDNSASWVIDVNKTGIYKLIINDTTGSGHTYIVSVADAEGWLYTKTQTEDTYTKGNHVFDAIIFNEVGKYMVRLKNGTRYSNSVANKIYLDYLGGAVINVPATLPNDDAILSGSSTINEQGYISFSNNNDPANFWVVWNVNFTKIGSYTLSAMVKSSNMHQYQMELLDSEDNIIATLSEDKGSGCEEIRKIGTYAIPAIGQYKIRISNLVQWSEALFKDVTITYAGGAVIDVPATLPNEEALLTGSKISRTADGIKWGNNEDITEDYATWNISVAEEGDYLVTMAVRTGETSGHEFFINIYDGDSQQVGETITETTKTPITLAAGTYTVHLGNNRQWSSAVMASVAIKSAGGTVVEMPGTLQAGDALLGGDDNVKVDGDGYICFSKDGNVPNCWATWQTNWVKTGTYDVIMDVNATNGHQLVVEVLDGETVIETFEHGYSEESGKLSIGKFELSETKSYTIRLTNKHTWSNARIKSIAFIPFITIDNDDTNVDFTEYKNQFVSIQLNRTFTGGMYNPICLPFALSSAALQNILKSEKSYVLRAATLEGQKLYVELEEGSSIYQGTPNMIKPSEDVVNPVFTNVEIKATSPDQTTKGVLRLQGSFASRVIDDPQNALLVGANNTLFFPSDDTPYIKSMRAYFILQDIQPSQMPKFACFREPGNAPTWMPIVGAETEKPNGKFIRDGRFVIVREGKEYNAQGIEL